MQNPPRFLIDQRTLASEFEPNSAKPPSIALILKSVGRRGSRIYVARGTPIPATISQFLPAELIP